MILRTIVEQKGLASAQAVLNMSQSSVSASLSELEDRLGLRLCNRGRSGFALTEAGRIVYEATHDLFDAVGRFSASAAAISDATRGILRIGAVDAVATNSQLPLASALRRFKSFAKNVLVDFLNAGPEDLEAQVLQGKRDVVIGPPIPNVTRHSPTCAYTARCNPSTCHASIGSSRSRVHRPGKTF